MQQKVEINFLEEYKFEVNAIVTGTKLCIDQKSQGYKPSGPNPLEVFLSSLGACMGVFAKKYLTRHNLEFKKLKVEVEAEFITKSPMHLVNIRVKVYTDAGLGDKKDTFMRFIKNCPIHNTIVNTKAVEISIV